MPLSDLSRPSRILFQSAASPYSSAASQRPSAESSNPPEGSQRPSAGSPYLSAASPHPSADLPNLSEGSQRPSTASPCPSAGSTRPSAASPCPPPGVAIIRPVATRLRRILHPCGMAVSAPDVHGGRIGGRGNSARRRGGRALAQAACAGFGSSIRRHSGGPLNAITDVAGVTRRSYHLDFRIRQIAGRVGPGEDRGDGGAAPWPGLDLQSRIRGVVHAERQRRDDGNYVGRGVRISRRSRDDHQHP